MTRTALYARYSSDNQSVASIDDQFRICRDQAAREKWKVVSTYKDAAISGASVTLRPGVQALLQDAQAGKFDIVLAEALDRVSRDQADVAMPTPAANKSATGSSLGYLYRLVNSSASHGRLRVSLPGASDRSSASPGAPQHSILRMRRRSWA